ncbi:hypothetical protein AVEN_197487-1 [Araneus ventricosus]|uniref:Uncharacterized protein n=1 Tax=Araneus ventricosus TaxID=182803 RepID=A0A4Y2JV23_ARAVE|nr:hypothetical protein AVEN_197487-1 [Araneus ventricosus]
MDPKASRDLTSLRPGISHYSRSPVQRRVMQLDSRQLENVKGELLKLKKKEAADFQLWHNVARTEERKKQKNKEIADCQTWHNVGKREDPKKQKNKEIAD